MVRLWTIKAKLLLAILMIVAMFAPLSQKRASASAPTKIDPARLVNASAGFGSALYVAPGGGVGCRKPTRDETAEMLARDLTQELHVDEDVRPMAQTGLRINLRMTPALDQNPAAKAALQRAAAEWEAQIRTPISIIVDVDFGTTFFGEPFPEGVAGLTNPQMLAALGQYLSAAGNLWLGSSTQREISLYNALPQLAVPTDQGDMENILGPTAQFRAIGFIDAVANPDQEPQSWGPPPSIGLNSNVDYDFDSSDGIDPGKTDFESVAVHELGHVLGFESAVGQLEVNPDCIPGVTVWDLFRVRPGANLSNFATAERPLKSGGVQVFFNGDDQWQLSTGKPDKTGGDEQQPSHWKDDSEVGLRIGVMDPTIDAGRRQAATLRDLSALDIMGYALKPIGNSPPNISSMNADLNGDKLTMNVFGTDTDGDVVKAKLTLLDQKDHVLGETAPFDIDAGIPAAIVVQLDTTGLSQSPAALHVGLVLIDTHNNESKLVIADFSGGDTGGPRLSSANYKSGRLVIKGKRLGSDLQVEVNGSVATSSAAPDVTVSNKRITVDAPSENLNIRSGANRLRVIANGLRSNLIVMNN